MSLDSPTLVLVCRRPTPGSGKRRLARELGEDATQTLADLMLVTALEDLAHWPGARIIAPADASDAAWARSLPVDGAGVIPQPGGNLGDRIAAVDRLLRLQQHTALLYIGSDAPVLGPDDYLAARAALTRHDVVLGPALDGGVTCMGSRHPWPPLADLPWGTPELHAALQSRCEQAGFNVENIATRYDIDVANDLQRLAADLQTDKRPARQALYRALESLGYCAR
ncbi:MAG: DUF2064 domain-containing protein [Gammaproteobacteria bacterium]